MNVETTTNRDLAKRLVFDMDLYLSNEPKVIMGVTYVTPPYFGGQVTEAEAMVSAKTYFMLTRRRAA